LQAHKSVVRVLPGNFQEFPKGHEKFLKKCFKTAGWWREDGRRRQGGRRGGEGGDGKEGERREMEGGTRRTKRKVQGKEEGQGTKGRDKGGTTKKGGTKGKGEGEGRGKGRG
jgi:hypothetical protein